jgi:beta-glucosidase/6-phospho-beta-glucosidase/beta-galactosidase|nr:MAG TPA: hypothetical protein [Caudoviricetes sp.]
MSIRDKFHEIMEKEDDFDELIGEVKDMLESEKQNGNIKNYNYESDIDVFDSCGLDIYYLSICWVDNNDELQIAGASYCNS